MPNDAQIHQDEADECPKIQELNNQIEVQNQGTQQGYSTHQVNTSIRCRKPGIDVSKEAAGNHTIPPHAK